MKTPMRTAAGMGFVALSVIVLAIAVAATSSRADGRGHRTMTRPTDGNLAAPPKDCTRLNGRRGYYGNPWCTPEEQHAFDLWDARRAEALRRAR